MRIPQQIGWSQESKLLWNAGQQLDKLITALGRVVPPEPIPPPPPVESSVFIPNDPRFDIPSYGSFTIEWWMKMTNDDGFPRIYSIGQYPAQNAVSIEGGTLYLWLNGGINQAYSLVDYVGQWVHVVVMRYLDLFAGTTNIGVYINGSKLGEISNINEISTNGLDLYIGSENAPGTYLNGLLSNFRWSLTNEYDGAGFPSPQTPLGVTSQTKLLMFQGSDLATESADQSGLNTPVVLDCVYNTDNPFIGYEGSLQFGTI
jgi:hypothetical protein